MAKITDVAAKAGVAKSTVSNVLTGNKFVSDELKRKVLAACAELDFHPNFFASGLSRNKTNIIALLLENNADVSRNTFYSELIIACLSEASEKGYSLLIYYNSDKNKLLDALRQGRAPVDGAILMSPCVNDERIAQMESDRISCVVIGRPDNPVLNYVDVDNRKLTRTVAERLIKAYGKDIYLINSMKSMTISQDRQCGFTEACNEAGIDAALHIFESAGGDEERGYEIASSVMKKGISIITPNGRTARGVYRAAKEAGLKIGKDVAVFALGRSLSRGEFTPSLSYAAQDYGVLGRTAVDLLLEEIDNGRQMEPVLVQSDVIVAESSPEF
ncbi:MAG: LacI family DNA-binding transcriptional regulator [Christensenellaceae bacterium]|nr:LacI family DNA-binding transcriptional regulator [Christensenellaceae bacterium]